MPCPYTLRYDVVLHLSGNRYITTIDIAEVYSEGHSERIVAEALSNVRVDA